MIHRVGFSLDIAQDGNSFEVSGFMKMWNYNEDLTVDVPAGPYTELVDLLPPGTLDQLGTAGVESLFGIPSSPYSDPYAVPPGSDFDFEVPTPTVNTSYQTCVNAPNSIGCSACNFPEIYGGGYDYCGNCEAAYAAQANGQAPTTVEPDFEIYCSDF